MLSCMKSYILMIRIYNTILFVVRASSSLSIRIGKHTSKYLKRSSVSVPAVATSNMRSFRRQVDSPKCSRFAHNSKSFRPDLNRSTICINQVRNIYSKFFNLLLNLYFERCNVVYVSDFKNKLKTELSNF